MGGQGGPGPAHQRLHVVHGAQVVPDDLGRDLPTDVLAELVPDTDHVEVPVHTCGRKGPACWGGVGKEVSGRRETGGSGGGLRTGAEVGAGVGTV